MVWYDRLSKRNTIVRYGAEHVHLLRRQIDRNLTLPHEFVVMGDDRPEGLDPAIRFEPMRRKTVIPNTMLAKLNLFRPDMAWCIGRRIFYMDLDTVVVGNLDAIAGRSEPLVLWYHPRRGQGHAAYYNTSFILLDAGVRPDIWEEFDRERSGVLTRQRGWRSSDQDWVSYCVGPDAPVWTQADGVYWWRQIGAGPLPKNAAIVTYPGMNDPSMPHIQQIQPWIARHRR